MPRVHCFRDLSCMRAGQSLWHLPIQLKAQEWCPGKQRNSFTFCISCAGKVLTFSLLADSWSLVSESCCCRCRALTDAFATAITLLTCPTSVFFLPADLFATSKLFLKFKAGVRFPGWKLNFFVAVVAFIASDVLLTFLLFFCSVSNDGFLLSSSSQFVEVFVFTWSLLKASLRLLSVSITSLGFVIRFGAVSGSFPDAPVDLSLSADLLEDATDKLWPRLIPSGLMGLIGFAIVVPCVLIMLHENNEPTSSCPTNGNWWFLLRALQKVAALHQQRKQKKSSRITSGCE